MLHLLANPGAADTATNVMEMTGGALLVPAMVAIAVAAVLVVDLWSSKHSGRKIALIIVSAVALLAFAITVVMMYVSGVSEHRAAARDYQTRVGAWLRSDYGIETNDAALADLIAGHDQIVTFDDAAIDVAVRTDATGELAVIELTTNRVLTPVGH